MVVVQRTNEFLKAGLYDRDLKVIVHSTFKELCVGTYETSLIHNLTNDFVHEHG